MEEVITFDQIREVFESEKKDVKLSKIDEGFFERVKKYLEMKERAYEETKNEKILQEIKTTRRMVDEIFNTRLKKLINSVFIFLKTGVLPENMLKVEEEIFFKLIDVIKEFKKKVKIEKSVVKVKMNFDIPSFVGPDGKNYGPYKKDEIVELDESIANYLILNNFATKI